MEKSLFILLFSLLLAQILIISGRSRLIKLSGVKRINGKVGKGLSIFDVNPFFILIQYSGFDFAQPPGFDFAQLPGFDFAQPPVRCLSGVEGNKAGKRGSGEAGKDTGVYSLAFIAKEGKFLYNLFQRLSGLLTTTLLLSLFYITLIKYNLKIHGHSFGCPRVKLTHFAAIRTKEKIVQTIAFH